MYRFPDGVRLTARLPIHNPYWRLGCTGQASNVESLNKPVYALVCRALLVLSGVHDGGAHRALGESGGGNGGA
jgi:hypothetical protein